MYIKYTKQYYNITIKSPVLIFIYIFIFLFLVLAALSLCCSAFFVVSGLCGQWGLLSLQTTCSRCSGSWASVVVAHGLSSCSSGSLEHRFSSCGYPQHVISSRTRDQTRVPFIGRQILSHSTIRGEPPILSKWVTFLNSHL